MVKRFCNMSVQSTYAEYLALNGVRYPYIYRRIQLHSVKQGQPGEVIADFAELPLLHLLQTDRERRTPLFLSELDLSCIRERFPRFLDDSLNDRLDRLDLFERQ